MAILEGEQNAADSALVGGALTESDALSFGAAGKKTDVSSWRHAFGGAGGRVDDAVRAWGFRNPQATEALLTWIGPPRRFPSESA